MTDPSEREVCHKYMDVNLTGEVDAEFRSGFFHGWQARAALPGPGVEEVAAILKRVWHAAGSCYLAARADADMTNVRGIDDVLPVETRAVLALFTHSEGEVPSGSVRDAGVTGVTPSATPSDLPRAAAVEEARRDVLDTFPAILSNTASPNFHGQAAQFIDREVRALMDALLLPASPALPAPSVEEVADAMWATGYPKPSDGAPDTIDQCRIMARAVLALFPAAPQAEREFFEAAKESERLLRKHPHGMDRHEADLTRAATYDAMQEAADATP